MKNKMDYEELFSKMIKKYHSQMFLGQTNGAKAKENIIIGVWNAQGLQSRFIKKLNFHVYL